jgi:DNA (cytosine-5)-methyltransferase 1
MFNFIDLFAGIGGIRIPFQEMGGNCVFTSEWDKSCQKTYFDNFGERPFGDITKIDPKDIPPHDLLVAGFPCQPFSQAGLKKGFDDTRGTLFFYIANILNHHRPKAILLENVKRFRSHDGGNTFKVVEASLKKLGYKIFPQVLNAKHFGLPQNRERFFIVGFQNEIKFEFPKPINSETKLGDILENIVDQKYTISDRLWAGHQRRKKQHQENGYGFGYSLFDQNSKYTSTISARYYKDGSEILINQEGKNPRKITPKEAARLQGFPENFKITASDTQAYKQFGNSVAVPVIRAIALQMKPLLASAEDKNSKFSIVEVSKFIPKNIQKKIKISSSSGTKKICKSKTTFQNSPLLEARTAN